MHPFGVTIPATVAQGSEIPEGLMDNPVYQLIPRLRYRKKIFCPLSVLAGKIIKGVISFEMTPRAK
jgi:hypothetical protein